MRLHPVTAVIRAGRYGGNGLALPLFAVLALSSTNLVSSDWLFVVAPLGALSGVSYGVLSYLRFEYELTDDTLDVRAGVFRRREREIPLRRVQNVDVSRDVLQRALGVAVLRVETAGGGATEAELSVVGDEEAERLRREIRDRRRRLLADQGRRASGGDGADEADEAAAVGAPGTTTAAGAPGTTTAADPETRPLFAITPVELVALSVTRFRPGSLLFLLFAIPVADTLAVDLLLAAARPLGGPATLDPATLTVDQLFLLGVVGAPLALVGTVLLGAALSIVEYYDFRLGRTGDDLVYERGLLGRYSGSIPTDKIQTVTVSEPWLLRPLDFAGLAVETAGYAGERAEQGSQSAIPLSGRGRVDELAHELFDFEDPAFERPPARARRRYAVRYGLVVVAALAATLGISLVRPDFTLWYLPAALFLLVPVAAHLRWVNLGYYLGEDHVVLRRGFWTRRTEVVPYYRLQTVVRERSVFQRRLGLAHLVADTASSASLTRKAPTAFDVDAETAADLQRALRERLQSHLGRTAGSR